MVQKAEPDYALDQRERQDLQAVIRCASIRAHASDASNALHRLAEDARVLASITKDPDDRVFAEEMGRTAWELTRAYQSKFEFRVARFTERLEWGMDNFKAAHGDNKP